MSERHVILCLIIVFDNVLGHFHKALGFRKKDSYSIHKRYTTYPDEYFNFV